MSLVIFSLISLIFPLKSIISFITNSLIFLIHGQTHHNRHLQLSIVIQIPILFIHIHPSIIRWQILPLIIHNCSKWIHWWWRRQWWNSWCIIRVINQCRITRITRICHCLCECVKCNIFVRIIMICNTICCVNCCMGWNWSW